MTDAEKFRMHLGRFAAALSTIASQLERGEAPSAETLLAVVERLPQETETACRARCVRTLRAYSYVLKNDSAFKNIQALSIHPTLGLCLTDKAIFALYLFFGAGDLYAEKDPDLALVIDAIVKAEGG